MWYFLSIGANYTKSVGIQGFLSVQYREFGVETKKLKPLEETAA
jgi:hypothetical protein